MKVPNCIADNPKLQGKPLSVYIAMRRDIDRDGQALVSYSKLMERTGFARPTIGKAITALVRCGCITPVKAGAQRLCYRFTDETGSTSEPVQPLSKTGSATEPDPVQPLNRFTHTSLRTQEQEPTATTAREAAGAGEAAADPEGATEAWAAVESLIGLVPPILEPSIDAAIARFGGAWVATACSRAAKANVRRWDYVSAILDRWAVDGFDSPRPAPSGGRLRGTPSRTPGRRANLGAGPQPADRDSAGYAAWRSPEHDRIDELVRSGMPRYEAAEQARAERKAGAGMT